MATCHTGMATASMSARFILRLTLAMSFAAICWKSVAADTSSKGPPARRNGRFQDGILLLCSG